MIAKAYFKMSIENVELGLDLEQTENGIGQSNKIQSQSMDKVKLRNAIRPLLYLIGIGLVAFVAFSSVKSQFRGRIQRKLTVVAHSKPVWYDKPACTYQGEEIDGKPHGQGKVACKDTMDWVSYSGGWKDGLRHGKGKFFIVPQNDMNDKK